MLGLFPEKELPHQTPTLCLELQFLSMKNNAIHPSPSSCVFKSKDGKKQVFELYDKILKKWPVENEFLHIPTRHGTTFVIASGNPHADHLILLHGAGSNSLMWIDDIAMYSKHYRVFAVDLIGEAGKSSANRPSWKGQAYAHWLEDLYAGLAIDTATIIGISQGGWTALKFATARPARVKQLVLICPGGIVNDNISFIVYAFILKSLGSWGIRHVIEKLFGDEQAPDSVLLAMTLTMKNFQHRLEIPPLYSNKELNVLTMPTLFIGGTKDPLRNSIKIAERLRMALPHLTVELIPGGGHAINDTASVALPFLLAGDQALIADRRETDLRLRQGKGAEQVLRH